MDNTGGDKFVLDIMPKAFAALQENVERDLGVLRASMETLKRQPVTSKRDFLIESVGKVIANYERCMGSLSPARRMVNQYNDR